MTHNQILTAAFNKLYAAVGREQVQRLNKAAKEDAEWMIACAEENAVYGYGAKKLKVVNQCARDYVEVYGNIGSEFCDLLGSIGWARCAEDTDYEQEKWSDLEQWAKAA